MNLVYERRGAGQPLVLLHGIGHHWHGWEPVLDRLAAVHDVIAVDLPGFGGSPVLPEGVPPGLPGTVDAVAAFLGQLGVHRPHLAGNSLGGAVALELGAAGLASSVTAFSPAGFYTPWQRRWAGSLLNTHRLTARAPVPVLRMVIGSRRLRALCFGALIGRPVRLDPERALADAQALAWSKGFRGMARSARGYSFTGSLTVPVTIAWGTRDRVLSPRQAEVARRRLPDARYVELPRCGHVPMNDDPELVASVILATTSATLTT